MVAMLIRGCLALTRRLGIIVKSRDGNRLVLRVVRVMMTHQHLQVLRDANDNFGASYHVMFLQGSDGLSIDTVAASTFQLHEVFNSYRHSGDQASKRRVRESCNAAVKGLPDWPSN